MTRTTLAAIAPGALVARDGEVAVVGLGRSGAPVARLLARAGHAVYASDAGTSTGVRATAEALRSEGMDVEIGGHDLARIARAAAVVTSPGVPPGAAPIVTAVRAGVPILSEVEVGLRALPDTRTIAITGTNGKTTTTALIGHLLRALGLDAAEGGNFGTPLSEYALEGRAPAWVALELSSFQLRHVPSLRPVVGVVTNLSSDHLDWYDTVAAYWADKARLLLNDDEQSRWVLNADDPEVLALHQRLPEGHPAREALRGQVLRFSLHDRSAEASYDQDADALLLFGDSLLPRRDLPLLGPHNVANALAAVLAVAAADPAHRSADARARLAGALRTAHALPHRMEPVGEYDGVLWINDSKATNVSSTRVALEGMARPFVLLLGGRHKGEPYTSLAEPFAAHGGRVVVAFGESAPIVESDLGAMVRVERVDGDFDAVIARARSLARPGDAILLSPACSSYDMFRNYEERGAAFRRLAGGHA